MSIDPRSRLTLKDLGRDILGKGGHDDVSDDELLLLELIHLMPGETVQEYQDVFCSLREQYGEDALRALHSGYVKIEGRR